MLKILSKKTSKGGISLILIALIVQMTFMSAFFVVIPQAEAQVDEGFCAVDVDAVLIIDRSGSMGMGECEYYWPDGSYKGTFENFSEEVCHDLDKPGFPATFTSYGKLAGAQSAANSFLGNLGTNDQSALVSFSTTANLDQALTSTHSNTISAVNSLVPAGSTNISEAINTATIELNDNGRSQATKVMILLTDGRANRPTGDGTGENDEDVQLAKDMADAAYLKGYKIFTIGLGDDVNTSMLQYIADNTNAKYYSAPSPENLSEIYNSIAQDICDYGSISGCKYNDVDNSGTIEQGEETLSGWEIQLIGCPYPADGFGFLPKSSIVTDPEPGQAGYCTVMDTTTTGDDGCYSFTGLEGLNYGVNEVVTSGWNQTYPANEEFYYFDLAVGEAKIDIDFANHEIPEEPEVLTINAFKVVCDTEADLPNWGAIDPVTGEPLTVTSSTASDYVAAHSDVCRLESGWDFQWGYGDKAEVEGVDLLPGDFVGEADGTDTSAMCSAPWCGPNTNTGTEYNEWKTFGSTDESGLASTSIDSLLGATSLWVREILKTGFHPFTHPPEAPDANDVSAELYCQSDIVNYDNYDMIENPQMGGTFNCVAFNAPLSTPEPVCGDGTVNQESEQCDDGNTNSGDGCSSTCQNEGGGGPTCGDGRVNQTNEQCDDGNNTNGDGCSASCQNEGGGSDPECGDGSVNQSSEQCDDGNNTSGDGCSASCQNEGGGGGGGGGLLIPTNRGGETPVVLGEEGEPVLTIEKSKTQEFANPGDQGVRYTIVVTNTGNLTAFNVVLQDVMPTGLNFADTEGNTKNWELGDMEPGDIMELTYLVNVDANAVAQTYTNLAEANADNHDAVSATADLEVRAVEVLAESGFSRNELIVLLIALISVFNVIHFMKRREVEGLK